MNFFQKKLDDLIVFRLLRGLSRYNPNEIIWGLINNSFEGKIVGSELRNKSKFIQLIKILCKKIL
jgi:hypothetical protein